MVAVGRKRLGEAGLGDRVAFAIGNAEALPFPDKSFDAYTIAFGIRNVTHIDRALAEAFRVLKTGGRFLCLEFSACEVPLLDRLYDFHSFEVIPRLGALAAGSAEPYQYLVESIRKFPTQEPFAAMIRAAGFGRVALPQPHRRHRRDPLGLADLMAQAPRRPIRLPPTRRTRGRPGTCIPWWLRAPCRSRRLLLSPESRLPGCPVSDLGSRRSSSPSAPLMGGGALLAILRKFGWGSRIDFKSNDIVWWYGAPTAKERRIAIASIGRIRVEHDDSVTLWLYDRNGRKIFLPTECVRSPVEWAAALGARFPSIQVELPGRKAKSSA